jgi:hypothetical protein
LKLSDDVVSSERQMTGDVLEEAPGGLALSNNASDIWPEVTLVGFAESVTSKGKGLAGVAASDEIHHSTPASSIEGAQVTPDRRRSQATLLHLRRQSGDGERFPLHHADRASASEPRSSSSGVESEVKPPPARTKADGT